MGFVVLAEIEDFDSKQYVDYGQGNKSIIGAGWADRLKADSVVISLTEEFGEYFWEQELPDTENIHYRDGKIIFDW